MKIIRKAGILLVLAIVLAALAFMGCPMDSDSTQDTVVSDLALDGLVTAPAKGVAPLTPGISAAQYTGTIKWWKADGGTFEGNFVAATAYKAVVTLTANSGYTFTGLSANSFTYTGATVTAVIGANDVTITITFPAIGGELEPVTALALDDIVTAPVNGRQPAVEISITQYTGTIAWQKTSDNSELTGNFAGETVYKAVISLTAAEGWTFTSLQADSFTYTEASSATAVIGTDGNTATVTITFQATGTEEPEDSPVTTLVLDSLVTAPVAGAAPLTTTISVAQYTGTVAWKKADDDSTAGAAFAAATAYKAVVTLTATSGYTFTGLQANSFTYTGASSATTVVGTDGTTAVVTITFQATGNQLVNALSLTSLVTAPAKDAAPVTTGISAAQYTGIIAWKKADDDSAAGAAFAAATAYKAVVTLTAASGYTFTGLSETSFTHTGASSVTTAVGTGGTTATVTITFPATGNQVVNALALDSLITAPAKDATPVTTGISAAQYTGTVEWRDEGDTPVSGNFDVNSYKAVVSLTAASGYTFTGLSETSFTYTGASSVSTAVGTGGATATVTITFPQISGTHPQYLTPPTEISTPTYVNWQQLADTGFTDHFGTTKLYGAAHGNDRYVVVGQDGKAAWSRNGIYWKASSAGTGVTYYNSGCNAITFVNGKFYTFGADSGGTPYIVSSTDGDVWTQVPQTAFTTNGSYIFDIAYGEGVYVIVSDGFDSGTSYPNAKIAWSTDLENWTVVSNATDVNAPLYQVEYAEGVFVVFGGNNGRDGNPAGVAAWSEDGKAWTFTDVGTQSRGLAYGKGTFVAVGRAGASNAKTSTDGKTWSVYDLTWNQFINAIVFGGGKFLIGGNGQAKITENPSADANWTAVSGLTDIFTSGNWINGAGWGNNRFIAVGDGGLAAISTN
jgi:hypothetical protein